MRDAGSVKPCTGGAIGTSIDGVTANGKALVPGTHRHDGQAEIPSTFKVTVGNHGNCPVRGIEIHLTEGNEKTQQNKRSSRCCPARPSTKTSRRPATRARSRST